MLIPVGIGCVVIIACNISHEVIAGTVDFGAFIYLLLFVCFYLLLRDFTFTFPVIACPKRLKLIIESCIIESCIIESSIIDFNLTVIKIIDST